MRIQKFLDTAPLFALYVAYARILGDFQKHLASERVHFLQALILTGLFFEERPVRPTEMAATFGVSRSNLSHALRELEKRGWIERKLSPADARAYLFSLSREGRKKVPRLIKIFDATQEEMERATGGKRIAPQLKRFIEIYQGAQGVLSPAPRLGL
ncbi:MAG: MarR family winged helix-turn-helix transcriptional regulator [Bdellovibrionales bacterium]